MDLKSRIERLENSKVFEDNLEEWSRTMQYRLGISYGKGAPTSYMPAEEFLVAFKKSLDKVFKKKIEGINEQ